MTNTQRPDPDDRVALREQIEGGIWDTTYVHIPKKPDSAVELIAAAADPDGDGG